MTHVNHSRSRLDSADAVVAAYIHEISARHAPAPTGDGRRRGDRRRHAPRRPAAGRIGSRRLPIH